MDTKLTLRLSADLIERAKKQAHRHGRSLSQMVADYFQGLKHRFQDSEKEIPLTPIAASLRGSLRGSKMRLKDYRRHLQEKYL